MARCSCGLEKDGKTGMCPSCDSADYIEVKVSRDFERLRTKGRNAFPSPPKESVIHRKPRTPVNKAAAAGRFLAIGLILGLYFSFDVLREQFFPSVSVQVQAVIEDAVVAVEEAEQSVTVPDRLLPVVSVSETGPYKLLKEEISGEPFFFDPCRPIFWVVNTDNEPPGSRELLFTAFDKIQEHTGLLFVFSGETDEPWRGDRSTRNTLYSDIDSRWNPVIVWWLEHPEFEEAAVSQGLRRDAAGFAGGVPEFSKSSNFRLVTVTGSVTMDAVWSREIIRAGYPQELEWALAHEIGHVVGLDHVDARGHLMSGENVGYQPDFGPGDKQGLAVVGAQSCLTDLEFPQ